MCSPLLVDMNFMTEKEDKQFQYIGKRILSPLEPLSITDRQN